MKAFSHALASQKNPEKLRACPFCNGDQLYMDSELIDDTRYHFVVCRNCGAEGPACAMFDAEVSARISWNGGSK